MLERLGLVIFGLVLGLLLLEGGLRVAAFATRRWYAYETPAPLLARTRILALGDSNTFGLLVGKIRAYPQILETQWNARADRRPIDVVNAGYPGNTAWTVRGQLGDLLASYRPDVVTVMVGGNDAWRDGEPTDDVPVESCVERARQPAGSPEVSWTGEWRLLRALRLLDSLLGIPLEQMFADQLPGRSRPDAAWPSILLDNLSRITDCARRAGAQVVFLTYPSSEYGIANDALRVAAARARVPLIDLARAFAPRCPRSRCDYLFPDQHPTAAGHAWAGEILVDALPAAAPALGGAGG